MKSIYEVIQYCKNLSVSELNILCKSINEMINVMFSGAETENELLFIIESKLDLNNIELHVDNIIAHKNYSQTIADYLITSYSFNSYIFNAVIASKKASVKVVRNSLNYIIGEERSYPAYNVLGTINYLIEENDKNPISSNNEVNTLINKYKEDNSVDCLYSLIEHADSNIANDFVLKNINLYSREQTKDLYYRLCLDANIECLFKILSIKCADEAIIVQIIERATKMTHPDALKLYIKALNKIKRIREMRIIS